MSPSSRAYRATKFILLILSHVPRIPVPRCRLPTSSASTTSSTTTSKPNSQSIGRGGGSSAGMSKSARRRSRRSAPIDPGLLPERRETTRPERRQSYKRRSLQGQGYAYGQADRVWMG